MKAIKIHLKAVALFFSILIFFQGCTVYKSANVTLEEAVRAYTKVRIKTNDNQILKFKNVRVENDYYYGLNYKSGDDIRVRLDENKINKVQVKDKSLSTILSIGIPIVIVGSIIALEGSNPNQGGWAF